MKKRKLPNCYNKLFPILLLCATFFMGIAYATMNATNLTIIGDLVGISQDGIIISEVKLMEQSGANISNLKSSGYQTMLESHIELSDNDSSSYVTYEIKVYNNFDMSFTFLDVIYGEDFYDNTNIIFILEGLSTGDVIESKAEKTFKITFKYADEVDASSQNNILNSYLNFRFIHPVYYIESTGAQYLDTGILPDDSIEFDLEFTLNNVHQTQAILGSRTSMDDSDSFNLFIHARDGLERYKIRWDSNGVTGSYSDLPLNEWKKINVSKKVNSITFTSNGQTMSQAISIGDWESSNSIYLFSQNQIESVETRRAIMRLYSFKMYKSGILVRDYVPVLDQNGKACLFDKVSNTYFYNAGSGEFGYGINNNVYNYLQSSGTQYIDLDVKADSNTEVQFVMALDENFTNTQGLFGARDEQVTKTFNMFWHKNSFRWDYYSTNDYPIFSANFVSPTFVLANKTYVYVNSEVKEYNYTDEFSSNYNMYLYTINSGGSPIYITEGMKIYYFKVIKNGEVVRNLVPVVDSNNVACFYDIVSQKYFYNKGTGTFILG